MSAREATVDFFVFPVVDFVALFGFVCRLLTADGRLARRLGAAGPVVSAAIATIFSGRSDTRTVR